MILWAGLLERLIQTNAIWFIPDLTRDQATAILHAKEEGVSNFLYAHEILRTETAMEVTLLRLGSIFWNCIKFKDIKERLTPLPKQTT